MSSIRSILSYSFLLALVTFSLAGNTPQSNDETKADIDAFQKLLNQVDPPALHAALHDFSPKKFKHGMFQEDRTAVEAIHKEEPRVATGILKMANLVKRQNGTVTSTTPVQQSPEPATTRVTPVPLGGQSSTTPAQSPTTSSPSNQSPSPTSALSSPGPSLSPSMTSGQIITTTNAAGLTVISTIGGGATTISPSGSSSTSTSPSSLTSTLLHVSTLPNGQQSTITAVTVVGAGNGANTPTGTAGAGSTGTGSGQPGLQTGEAVMTRGFGMEMVVVLGAAVGVAVLL